MTMSPFPEEQTAPDGKTLGPQEVSADPEALQGPPCRGGTHVRSVAVAQAGGTAPLLVQGEAVGTVFPDRGPGMGPRQPGGLSGRPARSLSRCLLISSLLCLFTSPPRPRVSASAVETSSSLVCT